MKTRTRFPIVGVISSALLLMSCLLPGMIPLKSEPDGPMPYMEKDTEKVIEELKGGNWQYLQALAEEQYSEEDLAKPGTLTYTVKIADEVPTYFVYGWCAVDEETLNQNFEHIDVKLYFNDEELGTDVVQNLTYTSPDKLQCLDFGVLLSDWPNGHYELRAVATFDEKINDGMAEYDAGDYIFEYDVVVEKQKEGARVPSTLVYKAIFQ